MPSAVAARWVLWGRSHAGPVFVALTAVYFAAGTLGLHFAFVHASASPVWPPTGIAIAALLLFGRRAWPAIAAGAFLVNLGTSVTAWTALAIAAGNTLEALAAAWLIERFAGGARLLERARDFLRFVGLAGLASTAISASVGTATLVLSAQAGWNEFETIWLTWWLGDAAGALIVAPLLLAWGSAPMHESLRARPAETALLLLAVGAAAALVFWHPLLGRYPLTFLSIPPLLWAALRFGPRAVTTSVALLAAIATGATVSGAGPFVMGDDNASLLVLQTFMATIVALTLPIAALVWERATIERERAALFARERAARAEAEAANRARDQFMAMLSHELRNPLAAIANATAVLRARDAPPAVPARALEIVQRQTGHLARLIEDLLDVARVSSGKFGLVKAPVDLAEVVRRSVAALRGGARLDAHVVSVDLAPAWVDGDPARLSQIVDNLLVNAIKYTPAGGRIDVRTRRDGSEAVLVVRDSGIGIPADLLPRVFDLFTQGPRSLDRAQGGLGIGLTLAQRLAAAHGGRIDAASDGAQAGCAFTVRLPGIDGPMAPLAPAGPAPTGDPLPRPRRRILIIEDDPDGRAALRMQLEVAGHEVFEAASGDEGLAAAARIHPEIVLLDIGLPGVDGYEVAQRLRARGAGVRLIAITGYGQPRDRQRSMEAGIDQHLVKPVDADELTRLLG